MSTDVTDGESARRYEQLSVLKHNIMRKLLPLKLQVELNIDTTEPLLARLGNPLLARLGNLELQITNMLTCSHESAPLPCDIVTQFREAVGNKFRYWIADARNLDRNKFSNDMKELNDHMSTLRAEHANVHDSLHVEDHLNCLHGRFNGVAFDRTKVGRALVCAERDVANAMKTWLESQVSPPIVHTLPDSDKVSDLYAKLFSFKPADVDGTADYNRRARTFFEWGWYDLIVLQDIWLQTPVQQLSCAGSCLAHCSYYEKGQFRPRIMLLCTDPEYPLWCLWSVSPKRPIAGLREAAESAHGYLPLWSSVIDDHNAFDIVDVYGKNIGDEIERCWQGDIGQEQPSVGNCCNKSIQSHLQGSGRLKADLQNKLPHLVPCNWTDDVRQYVKQNTDIVIVEDKREDVQQLLLVINGTVDSQLQDDLSVNQEPTNGVIVYSAHSDIQNANSLNNNKLYDICHTYDQLVNDLLNSASSSGDRYLIFVTDILFGCPSWKETGIDLIEQLRGQRYLSEDDRMYAREAQQPQRADIGIVAYSGLNSPFVRMSAYQRGADFVVFRDQESDCAMSPVLSRCEILFLMTLAFLCFQKQFLKHVRNLGYLRVTDNLPLKADMERVLPRHAISIPMKKEWDDTHDLLWARGIYAEKDFNDLWDEFRSKDTKKPTGWFRLALGKKLVIHRASNPLQDLKATRDSRTHKKPL